MKGPFEPRSLIHIPRCCADDDVQRFIEIELLNVYSTCPKLTAAETFAAARKAFGDLRCDTLFITVH